MSQFRFSASVTKHLICVFRFTEFSRMKRILLALIFPLFAFVGHAQDQTEEPKEEKKGFDKSRLVFGGDAAVSFGTQQTVIGASPILGYRLTDRYSAGIGGTYYYFRWGPCVSSIYGANLWNRYRINESLFLQGEYHVMNVPGLFETVSRANIQMLYVGGGYRLRLGERVSMVITALYDVFDEPLSPFSNPIIRGGLVAGF